MHRTTSLLLACGLAAVSQPSAAQQRATPITSWITDADFPSDPGKKRRDGSARVRFTVTPAGRAANCTVQHATVSDEVQTRICELIQERARYIPAYAKSGDPIEAEDELGVSWRSGKPIVGESDFGGALPANNPTRWVTPNDSLPAKLLKSRRGRVEIFLTFRIGSDGRVSDCQGTSPASPDAAASSCKLLSARARFRPPVGRDGNPIETDGRTVIRWETRG